MQRRLWYTLSLLVVFALAVSFVVACSTPPAPTPTAAPKAAAPAASPTSAPAKPTTASPTAAPAKPAVTPAAAAPAAKDAPGKVYKVGVSKIVTHPALDQAYAGFLEGMKKAGFEEGKNISYEMNDAQGDMATNQTIAQKLVTSKPDLILGITTPSSQAVTKLSKDIPVVFLMVTDPKAAGIVADMNRPGGNVTGVSDMEPMDKQMDFIMEVMPKVKKLGIVYNAGETNSVVQVDFAKNYLKGKVEVVDATASNTGEVMMAAQSLVGRADAIWIPTDNTAGAALDSIYKVGEANKLPVFVADLTLVEGGGLGTAGVTVNDLGVKAGEMAAKILRGEAKPGDIPVYTAKEAKIWINKKAAAKYGITIPDSVLKKADKVYE